MRYAALFSSMENLARAVMLVADGTLRMWTRVYTLKVLDPVPKECEPCRGVAGYGAIQDL